MSIMRMWLPIVLLFLLVGQAEAGDCLEEDQVYVKTVERSARGAKVDQTAKDVAFSCLATFAGCELGNRNNKWAGKKGTQCLARARQYKYKKRLAKACSKIAKKKGERRDQCVLILARTGVQEAEGLDVYAELVKLKNSRPRTFAALNDLRAIPYLIERYKLRLQGQAAMKGKDRWKTRKLTDDRRNVINALWHFASPESKSFLESVVLEAADKDIVKRAQGALQRIAERS